MLTTRGEVRLAVPAAPEFLRLARLTAASLASRMGFTYDEVEDLRIAIDELCFSIVGSKGRPGTLDLHYRIDGDGLVVEGVGRFDGAPGPDPALSEFSELILNAVTDEHDLIGGDRGPGFRLLKRRTAA